MNEPRPLSRRTILQALSAVGVGTVAFQRTLAAQVAETGEITTDMVKQAEWVAELELNDAERESVAKSLRGTLESALNIRKIAIDADTAPAQVFRPISSMRLLTARRLNRPMLNSQRGANAEVQVAWSFDGTIEGLSDDELAFTSIGKQASLLERKKLSSRELTQMYLGRLKKYDSVLKCVITLLEEHALECADASDARRAKGASLGVLDGIPWVAKDLICDAAMEDDLGC